MCTASCARGSILRNASFMRRRRVSHATNMAFYFSLSLSPFYIHFPPFFFSFSRCLFSVATLVRALRPIRGREGLWERRSREMNHVTRLHQWRFATAQMRAVANEGGGGRDGGPVVSAPIASSRLLFVAHAKETKQAKNKRRSRKPSRFWGLGYVTNFWLGLFLISVPHRHRVSRSPIFHNPK